METAAKTIRPAQQPAQKQVSPLDAVRGFLKEKGLAPSDDCTISFSQLSGGRSHITSRASIYVGCELFHDLVVKIALPDGPLAPYNVAHEANAMRFAAAAGIPAPELVGYLQSPDPDGISFIVMRYVECRVPTLGQVTDWFREQGETFRLSVGRSLLRSLVDLRNTKGPEPLNGSLSGAYRDLLNRSCDRLRAAIQNLFPTPALVGLAHSWLDERLGLLDADKACLHHGDFRIANVGFDGASLAAIFDWEKGMTGHPMHDLGYLFLPGMKLGDRVGGVLTLDELRAIWAEEAGEPLDEKLCGLFQILSMFTEFCSMTRASVLMSRGHGSLGDVRSLALIARLQRDIFSAMRGWDDGRFIL